MENALRGKRILITQSGEFMGPALCDVFGEQGAAVVKSDAVPTENGAVEKLIADAGAFDVLVANLAIVAPTTPAADVRDDEWREVFAAIVDPLPRLVRAVVPMMTARGGWVAR